METLENQKGLIKKERLRNAYHFFLIVIGSLLLAFGTAIFLTKNTIIAGGISGISFIIQELLPNTGNIIDICIWVLTGLLWFLSFFTLGKEFAFKTLLASILYPLFYTIFYRVPMFNDLATAVAFMQGEAAPTTGDLILNALFGGITIGFGIALTFIGRGSTGGLDVISMMLKKYFNINISVSSFTIDGVIIVTGIFALNFPSHIVNCLSGIISAFMTALVIQFVYNRGQNAFIMEVISDSWEKISEYITKDMNRGVSLIDITGGYTNQKRVILRSVLTRNEYIQIREFIANIDPTAFVTYTNTNAVFGEGFRDHEFAMQKRRKNKKDSNE